MAKPKLGLIPAAQGSKFYSVLPSSGVGDFTFSRSGSATRINSQGLIETVANGVSRLNYPMIDGKVVGCPHHILEPQSRNLIAYSEDFSNAAWIKQTNITVLDNQIISPNGTLNADKITTTSSSNFMYDVLSLTPSIEYTVSFYIKNDNAIKTRFWGSGESSVDISWNGKNIQNISSGSYEYFGNDWYKIKVTQQSASDGTYIVRIYPNETETTTNSVYIWGFQVEQGSYPTSYIPTNGSAVTRSAETANGSGDASTFNDSEGVLMAEISALDNDGTFRTISINGTPTNVNEDRIQIYYRNTADIINFGMESGNSSQFFSQFPLDVKSNNKLALKYSASSCSFWINGIKVGEELNKVMPTDLSRLDFNIQNGTDNFYGNTKQLQYFDSALTDSELETLTSWVSFSDMANGQLYTIQ